MDFSLDVDALNSKQNQPSDIFHPQSQPSDIFSPQTKVSLRLGFIRKVYGILSAQLLLTTIVGAFFMYNEAAKLFIQSRLKNLKERRHVIALEYFEFDWKLTFVSVLFPFLFYKYPASGNPP